ncbi:MAG TPA: methyltransferase [Bacteroidia bacterium]|jgi:ubiquinone/menaquinone biosynthesis C-methylase UbiE|nr:methyltransferase [Bacteroidia bacterium]
MFNTPDSYSVIINKRRIQKGFDFLCPFYDVLTTAFFGVSLITSQTYFIPQLKKKQAALILGGGTGTLLLELLRKDIAEKYYYLDISKNMIRKTQKKVLKQFPEQFHKIIFECGSYENCESFQPVDLIVTPYILDCFSQQETRQIMKMLHGKLKQNGQWLFIDFNTTGQSNLVALVSRWIIRILYLFFNLVCNIQVKKLPDFSTCFSELNLLVTHEKYFMRKMLVGRIYEMRESEGV